MGYYYHYDKDKIFISSRNLAALETAIGQPLRDLARSQQWCVEFDEEGNVFSLYFDEIKGDDNSEWLALIAPYVQRGSWIQIHGDDGNFYRYLFDGEGVRRIDPSWPEA